MRRFFPLFFLIMLTACAPQTPPVEADKTAVSVYVDAFGETYLPDLYACAERSPELLVSRTPDIDSANIILGITPALAPDAAAYQIDALEFAVVVNAQNPLGDLSNDDIERVYAGEIYNWAVLGWDDALIRVWAYSADLGVNGIFFGQGTLTSLAYQAESPRAMRTALENDVHAIGILPRVLVSENLSILSYKEIEIPMLFLLPNDNDGLKSLAICLDAK